MMCPKITATVIFLLIIHPVSIVLYIFMRITRRQRINALFALVLTNVARPNTFVSSAPIPIDSHSSFRPINSQYGLLASSDGGIRTVEFPQDHHPSVNFGLKSNGQRPVSHVKSSVLTCTVLGLLLRCLFSSLSRSSWVLFAVALGLYLLEAFFCSTRRYLSNISETSSLLERVALLRLQPPSVHWDLECYHYQQRYHYSKQDRSHESHKVVTYRARQYYRFQDWKDVTSTKELLQSLEYNPVKPFLKVTILKLLVFANESTHENYLAQQAHFYSSEGNQDIFMDTSASLNVAGCLPKLLARRTILNAPTGPFCMALFWLCTGLLLTVPYRIWFSCQCDEVSLVLAKEVKNL